MKRLIVLLLAFSWNMPLTAAEPDLISLTTAYEQQYQIPRHLIFAIAHQESGRSRAGVFAPWPWTLNIDGAGYYYDTQEAAEKAAVEAINAGSSVDLGFGQVNWYWNGSRFESPAAALVPETNIRVAARILNEWYLATGSWVEAIARYHTGPITSNEELLRARSYATKVMTHHERLLQQY